MYCFTNREGQLPYLVSTKCKSRTIFPFDVDARATQYRRQARALFQGRWEVSNVNLGDLTDSSAKFLSDYKGVWQVHTQPRYE
jgi:hypothetical protein